MKTARQLFTYSAGKVPSIVSPRIVKFLYDTGCVSTEEYMKYMLSDDPEFIPRITKSK